MQQAGSPKLHSTAIALTRGIQLMYDRAAVVDTKSPVVLHVGSVSVIGTSEANLLQHKPYAAHMHRSHTHTSGMRFLSGRKERASEN